MRSKSFDAEER